MVVYFNNPYDKVSVNTLQSLFVNDVYPSVINRTSADDDHGLWISYIPTVIMCKDDYTEIARIEDYKSMTPDAVAWMVTQYNTNIAQGKALDTSAVPAGVIIKS